MEGCPEKRPRIDAGTSPVAAPTEEAPQSPWPEIWRPDVKGILGRPPFATDSAGNDLELVAALG